MREICKILRPEWSMPSLFEREPERFASDQDPWAPKKRQRIGKRERVSELFSLDAPEGAPPAYVAALERQREERKEQGKPERKRKRQTSAFLPFDPIEAKKAEREKLRARQAAKARNNPARPGLDVEYHGSCTVLSLRDGDAWRKGRPVR